MSVKHNEKYCSLCGDGPFESTEDWQRHYHCKQHVRRSIFEEQWQAYLKQDGMSETDPN